ncbi:hypothetical protein KKF82_07575 [Patescibacteria group bacterium]|nr:hypothetical protein [Patescibacteria group bacterium]
MMTCNIEDELAAIVADVPKAEWSRLSADLKDSAVIQLLRLVWDNANAATGKSYTRLNQSMWDALRVAIDGGFSFDPDDYNTISEDFRFSRWGGVDKGGFAERFYECACVVDNVSACRAFEKWKGRNPVVADDVKYDHFAVSLSTNRCGGSRKRARLCVDAKFPWDARTVTVTSIASEPTRVVACSYVLTYTYTTSGFSRSKIDKRYTITPAMIQQERANRKDKQNG